MWTCSRPAAVCVCALTLALSAGCTVQPLNGSNTRTVGTEAGLSASVNDILRSTSVSPVNTRVAQQVRNALLFAMHGGEQAAVGDYRIDLFVTSTTTNLSVQTSSLSPTSAQVKVEARFNLVNEKTGAAPRGAIRRAFASFDRTNQSFANERAERDAQNRAAKELAQQIRLAVAQMLAEGRG